MNKKGFTLVELLAVIAILGLLVTTVSIAVTKIYNDNVDKTMIVQNNKVMEAAGIYLNDKCLLPLAGAVCPDSYTEGQYICLEDLTENVKENYLTEVTYKNDKCSGIIVFEENAEGEKVEPVSYLFCGYNSSKNTFNYATNPSLDLSKYPRCNVKKNGSSDDVVSTTKKPTTRTTTTTTRTTTKIVIDPGTSGGAFVLPANCELDGENTSYKLVSCIDNRDISGVIPKEKPLGSCNNVSYCLNPAGSSAVDVAFYLYYKSNGAWTKYSLSDAVNNNIITMCNLVDLGYTGVCKETSSI